MESTLGDFGRGKATAIHSRPEAGEGMVCDLCKKEEAKRYFRPCLHKACLTCVAKLRKANVYKPTKYATCPLCDTNIEQYCLKTPAQAKVPPSEPPPRDNSKYGRGGITSLKNANDYQVPRVATGSFTVRLQEKTQILGHVNPLRVNADLRAIAMGKGSMYLDRMLSKDYSEQRSVARRCIAVLPPFISELSVNQCGHRIIHRMIEYAVFHRDDDFFTIILGEMCKNKSLVNTAYNKYGSGVVQKMIFYLRTTGELRMVLECISGSVAELVVDSLGVFTLERLGELLIKRLRSGSSEYKFSIEESVEALVDITLEAISRLNQVVTHSICGPMLVEFIRWSLPHKRAIEAGLALAKLDKNLFYKNPCKVGTTLKGLLSLGVKNITDEIIASLQGDFLGISLRHRFHGPSLVIACLATQCVNDDTRLSILQKITYTEGSSNFVLLSQGLDLFKFALELLSEKNLKVILADVNQQFGCETEKKILRRLSEVAIANLKHSETEDRTPESEKQLLETQEDDQEQHGLISCRICKKEKANVKFIDCNHICCCLDCAFKWTGWIGCPECYTPVRGNVRVKIKTKYI